MSEVPSPPATIPPKSERLSWTTKLAYGAGDLGPAMTANLLVFYLLFFFTQVAGLRPALAGSILTIGKISDAINDPIVGVASDRTRTVWGRRLPWMVLGAIPFGVLFTLQWIVPQFSDRDAVNNGWLFAYYVAIGILFNLGYTVVNLPYTALTPELTRDYNERTSLTSFRFAFSLGGSILGLLLAGAIINALRDRPEQQFFVLGVALAGLSAIALLWCAAIVQERGARPLLTPSQQKQIGMGLAIAAGVSLALGIAIIVGGSLLGTIAIAYALLLGAFGLSLYFHRREPHLQRDRGATPSTETSEESMPFREQLRVVLANQPFLFVIGIYLFSWLAVQLTASILPYFVVNWMQLDDGIFPLVALGIQGTALAALFGWNQVSRNFGKRVAYGIGLSFWIGAQIVLIFVQPGQTVLFFALVATAGLGVSVAYLIPWSMVPDVIDLDELRTQQRREGIFYGFMVLLQKIGLALGLFIVGVVLDRAGFVESVPGEPTPAQPDSALFAIRMVVTLLPAVFLGISLLLAYFYPITREVHRDILQQLEARSQPEQ